MVRESTSKGRRLLCLAALLAVVAMPGCVAQAPPQAACDGPMNIAVTATADGNLVTWDEWSFARAYELWRATGDGAFEHIVTTAGDHPATPGGSHETTFLDEEVTPGETYTYRVRALAPPPHVSAFCGSASATAVPTFPAFTAVVLAMCGAVGAYAFGRRRA